jgi:hypothetical protein
MNRKGLFVCAPALMIAALWQAHAVQDAVRRQFGICTLRGVDLHQVFVVAAVNAYCTSDYRMSDDAGSLEKIASNGSFSVKSIGLGHRSYERSSRGWPFNSRGCYAASRQEYR